MGDDVMNLDKNEDQPQEPMAPDAPAAEQAEDTEGHMFLPNDPGTARSLAQGRSAEVERHMRDRQRQKEARPNRR
jgi:hypothetical protein